MVENIFKSMKKIMALVGMTMLAFSAIAGANSLKDYPRVAVMNFGNKAITSKGFKDQDFTVATEYAIYQLSASGWFDLIDYESLKTIIEIHNIGKTGLLDPATIVEVGNFAGAEYIIVGNVTGLTLKENIVGARAREFKGDVGEHVVNASVAVRIVDIKTGRIMAAGVGKGSSTSTKTEIGFIKNKLVEMSTNRIATNNVINTVINEYNANKKSDNTSANYNNNSNSSNSKSNNSYNNNNESYNNNFNANTNSNSSTNGNASSTTGRNLDDNASSRNNYGEGAVQTFDENANKNITIHDSTSENGSTQNHSDSSNDSYDGSDHLHWNGNPVGDSNTISYNDGTHSGNLVLDNSTASLDSQSNVSRSNSEDNGDSSYQNNSERNAHESVHETDRQVATQNSSGFNNTNVSRNLTDVTKADSNAHTDSNSNINASASANGNYNSNSSNGNSSSKSNNYSDNGASSYNSSSSNSTESKANNSTTYSGNTTAYTYVNQG